MEGTKVLYISQEITPYLPESEMSLIGRNLPQGMQEKGNEIRTFMPKYGCINERRNQLHEVIRLSGMNLIIDDTDHPLIIKVASIQAARMQVYFIDNEDYFQRKFIFQDQKGNDFEDNDERAIFFARGVLETVNKLQWSPDIVHCHGWFTHMVPLYLKQMYSDNPLFMDSRVVISLYDNEFTNPLDSNFKKKLLMDAMPEEKISILDDPSYLNYSKLAINYSDGVIVGSNTINNELKKYLSKIDKPVLDYISEENYLDTYSNFYSTILSEVIDGSK
ncbi:MAG: glycogen/starch synthase [Bacteroidales bacterium]|nr:glycogen/starch synthase [Bacteroidales bacterium]